MPPAGGYTPALRLILETAEGMPNVDVSRVFLDLGDHINNMPWDHAYLHEGIRYECGHFFGSIAQSNEIEMIVDVPSDATIEPHILFIPESGADVRLRIYEGATPGNDGTPLSSFNRRRTVDSNPDQSQISAFHTPTLASSGEDGTVISDNMFGGGSGPQSGGVSGVGRSQEWILERGLKYLVRATNLSTTAANMGLVMDWYEHDPITIG